MLILDEATSALDPKSEKEVQDAIDFISRDSVVDGDGTKLTIVMIAHRLQTIMTAQNLLYIDSSDTMLAGTKGSKEYDDIMKKLQENNYKHQAQQDEQDKQANQKIKAVKDKSAFDRVEEVKAILETKEAEGAQTGRKDEKSEGPKEVTIGRIMSFYRPMSLTFIGVAVSLICSLGWPLYGLIYSKILFIMMQFQNPKYLTFVEDRALWCGMFLLLVLCLFIFFFIQKYIFYYAGENLTHDIRNLLYRGIIFKDISWFDRKDRAPGILSNILSEDISTLNGMTTEHLGILIEAYGGLIIGTIIALFYTWKMGLVTMAFAPFISLGGIMMSRLAWKVKAGKAMGGTPENKDMRLDPY